MTLIVTQERVSGTLNDITAPYHVYDDAYAAVDADTATAAAVSQFNTDFGVAVTDYPYQQLSKHSWRVTCKYRPEKSSTKRTPEATGSITWRFSYQEPGRRFERSLETVVNYDDTIGLGGAVDFDRLINVRFSNDVSEYDGYDAPAPVATDIVELVLPNASFTEAYRTTIMDLRGAVNSTRIFGREPGTVRFCSAQSVKRSDSDLVLSIGFDYRPILTNVYVSEDITIPSMSDHDYLWVYGPKKQYPGEAGLNPYIKQEIWYAYVERLYPRKNLLPLLVIPGA